jgi:hypothetical protein
VGPFAAGRLFAPVGEAYAKHQAGIGGAGIRAAFGAAAVALAAFAGKKALGAKAAKGIGALAASGAVAGIVWPYVGPKVRALSAKAAGTSPAGIGSLVEGSNAELEAELLALEPAGVESMIDDMSEPAGVGGLGDQYAFDTESDNMLFSM